MGERRVFTARYNSSCRSCWKPIVQGVDNIYRTQMPSGQSARKNVYIHENCEDIKEHRHTAHWEWHSTFQRHRDKAEPDLHQYVIKGKEQPSQTQSQAQKVDLSSIENQLADLKVRDDVQQQELDQYGSKLEALQDAKPIEVIINKDGETVVRNNVGIQHRTFRDLVQQVAAGVLTMMKGPAGSGKTMAAAALAKALGLEFYIQPLGPQTSKSDLVGYMNGNGDYVPSMIRRAVEFGGVILLDEIDAANAAVLTIINGILSGDICGFADRMITKHPDCIFVCAANTFGLGADALYVGRAQQDAAMLDRWVPLEWGYDWNFAREIVQNDDWTDYVESLSDAVNKSGARVVIGPRAAIYGAKMLSAGIPRDQVEHRVIWARIKEDDRAKIRAALV